MEQKEKRIRGITAFFYTNPAVRDAMAEFAKDREVVPRYYEGFGKRPDVIQYGADVNGAVKKGATSFHGSEELWDDPLLLSSDISPKEMNELRRGWDLLIDIDSPFLDCSKIAAELLIAAIETHGIKNYGLKFSGSKGFHLIIPWKAFPKEVEGVETRLMFPEWPRAICGFLMEFIRKDYNHRASSILTDFDAIERRTKLSKDKLIETRCKICERPALLGNSVQLYCPVCKLEINRRNMKITKRRLKCLNNDCAGVLEIFSKKEYDYCDFCRDPDNEKLPLNSEKHPYDFDKFEGVSAEKVASLDLILVAPRHLFRMPYSLHEKTALASVVITKGELSDFGPKDADPIKAKIRNFMPDSVPGEAELLLRKAMDWKRQRDKLDKKVEEGRYRGVESKTGKKYGEFEFKDVPRSAFPPAIVKLLKGLEEGKKRGLFVLLTFLRSINYIPEEIAKIVNEWNTKNQPPLREGYVRTQIDWHIKQRKKIIPPNYSNDSFYLDLGIISGKQKTKNPLVDVKRALFKSRRPS